MILLSVLGGFFVGAWSCQLWGNHRSKYYRKQMKKTLSLASKVQDENKLIIYQMEKMKEGKRVVAINTMHGGLLDAISDLAREGV